MIHDQDIGYVTLLANIAEKVKRDGLRQVAREYRVDAGNLSNILNGRKPMQEKVANAFGFRSVVSYERIETTSVATQQGGGENE